MSIKNPLMMMMMMMVGTNTIASDNRNIINSTVKFSANDVLKYFSYFSEETGFDFHANCLHWRQ